MVSHVAQRRRRKMGRVIGGPAIIQASTRACIIASGLSVFQGMGEKAGIHQ
jgi:hypothetical protein